MSCHRRRVSNTFFVSNSMTPRNAKQLIRSFHQLLLTTLLLFVLSSCSNDSDDDIVPPEEVNFEILVPRNFLNGIGSELKLSAFINNEDVSDIISWSTSNQAIATIDNTGQLMAVDNGNFTVTAQLGDQTELVSLEVFPVSGSGSSSMDIAFISFLKKFSIPGGVFAISKGEKLVANKAYGLSDLSGGIMMGPTNLFRVASVSKPITGVAVMKLISEGKLAMTDKAFDILADLIKDVEVEDERIRSITIFQLLHHTAGWDRNLVSDPMFDQERIKNGLGIDTPPTASQVVQWLAGEQLQFDPGAKFAYHNLTYVVLGRVIEAVTGKTYEQYVQEEVFAPMGITTARIARTKFEERFEGEVVYDYRNQSSPAIFDPSINAKEPYGGMGGVEAMDAHGGWVMSVPDLARFGVHVDGNEGVPDLLSAEFHSEMIADPGFSYGAGWFLNPGNYNHSGGMPGTASVLWVDESRKFIIAGALNGTPIFGTQENADFFNEYVSGFLNVASSFNTFSDEDLFDIY